MATWAKFQSAPRVRTRGDATLTRVEYMIDVSIRAPRSHAGRLQFPVDALAPGAVSIRAPRSHAGRHPSAGLPVPVVGFQSAPRVRTRGDACQAEQHKRWTSFNPRPAFARGATYLKVCTRSMTEFQSAPRVRTRCDCGPANRQSRKPLLLDFREHREFSRVRSDSVVKELCKGSSFNAVVEERGIPAFESALEVRGSMIIKLTARSNRPV